VHTIQTAIPNNVTGAVTSVCENGSATVSWSSPSGCSDNVLVFATDGTFSTAIPTGNGATYIDNATFGSGSIFDGGYTVYKGTGNSVTITGLTNGTTYYFKIFTRNDLNWTNGVEVSCTPVMVYCASGSTSSADSEIENVTLIGVNNSITNNTSDICSTGVNDYTAMSADLEVGSSNTLVVEFGDCDNGSQFDGAAGVWIDWNNDGDFDDTDELIGTVSISMAALDVNVVENFTINVPATQPTGFYRMRIVQEEAGTIGTISPCGTFSWGSTEDYTIEIINSCVPTHTVSGFSPTSGPSLTEFTVSGSGFTSGTQVYVGGLLANVTYVDASNLIVEIPSGLTSGNKAVRVIESGCSVISGSTFTIIKDSGICGSSNFTDLIITEVYDSNGGNGWYMELYNPTSSPIDLNAVGTDFAIERYGNIGDPTPSRTIDLTGIVPANSVFTLRIGDATPNPCSSIVYDFTSLGPGINESDEIRLTKNGVNYDVVYCPNEIGYSILRNTTATGPSTTYSAADWTLSSTESCTDLGIFTITNNLPVVSVNPIDLSGCSLTGADFTITATPGGGSGVLTYQWYYNDGTSIGWSVVTSSSFTGVTVSGETTDALTLSGAIAGINNYQFYCEVNQDGSCQIVSDAAQIKIDSTVWNGSDWSNGVPDATKFATINGNYDTALHGSFECCSLLVNATYTLDIQANNYVEVTNDITNNGTLNVMNNGSLVQINDLGVNTGNISYRRATTGVALDYVYWSSPVDGVNTPSGYIYTWIPDVANPNGGQGNWASAANTLMQPAIGYIMRGVLSRNFIGVPRNGVFTPTIKRGSDIGAGSVGPNGVMRLDTDDNWNLLGNPYPSAISIGSFLAANTELDGFVRLWTHGTLPSTAIADPFYDNFVSNYTASDYIAINGSGATSGSGTLSVIGGGQSFFVLMNSGTATTSTALFNNAMRDKGYSNSQFYRSANNVSHNTVGGDVERHRIWLDLVTPSQTIRTLVAYVEGATQEKDRMFDATTGYKSAQNFYSLIDENNIMTIQGRALPFDAEDKVPLGFKTNVSGNYTLALAEVDGLFSANQNIYIEDKDLGVIHDLKIAPYNFIATAGIHNSRFVLRYTNEALSNEDFELNSNVLITASNTISIHALKDTIQSVHVHNVLGQDLLVQREINATTFEISSLQKNTVPLIVQVTLSNGVVVTKKIIY